MGDLTKTKFSEIGATLETLEALGMTRDHLDLIRSNRIFAQQIANFIVVRNLEFSENNIAAREIMGGNYLSISDAISCLKLNPTQAQIATLAKSIPFTKQELYEHRDTHVLTAVFPISILEIKKRFSGDWRLFTNELSYDKEAFANIKGKAEWQLVCKEPAKNSMSKKWREQKMFLANDQEIPDARVIVYVTVGYFLATGERFLDNVSVRCSSVYLDGHRVLIRNSSDGLSIGRWDDEGYDNIGLASAQKSV